MADGPDDATDGTAPTPSAASVRRTVLQALALMLLAGVVSSLLHVGVRVVSPEVPTMVIVFLRTTFTLLFTLPFMLAAAAGAWRTNRPGLQLSRAAVNTVSMATWYYALANLPLAEAGALSFTTALFVAVGAGLWLKEQVGPARWAAVVIGFIGAAIVLRPGYAIVTFAAILAVGSSALWALSLLMAKQLTRTDSSLTVAFYQPLLIAPMALLGALPVWVTPSATTLAVLVGMGLVAAIGNWAHIHALKLADASLVMPVDYVRLLWMAGWGFFLFSEIPALTTWAGSLVIIGATVFITWHETRRARSAS